MRLVVFTVPDELKLEVLENALKDALSDCSIRTHVHIFNKEDIETSIANTPVQIKMLRKIREICGDPTNRIAFTANFYRAVNEGFGLDDNNARVILTTIIEGRGVPAVHNYAEKLEMPFIFELAERTLGFIR